MKKSSAWKMACIVFMFCAASVIASPAQSLTTLHNFAGSDGANPAVGLVLATDGNLYGTSSNEGANGNAGTAFKITTGGTLSTLWNFCQSPPYCGDGLHPMQMIQGRDGNFYGVTADADVGLGNIFQLTPGSRETSLFTFCSILRCTYGSNPTSIMQASDGNFYGVVSNGGESQDGALWQLQPTSWTFSELGSPGVFPSVTLVQGRDGQLYGVAPAGGIGLPNCPSYCGTVFKITLSGNPTVLYNFCSQTNCTDGAEPSAPLVQGSDGNFCGTTLYGGANGAGVIFKITPSGTMTILHSFAGGEGNGVVAPLIPPARPRIR